MGEKEKWKKQMGREWKGLLELVSIAIPSHGMDNRHK